MSREKYENLMIFILRAVYAICSRQAAKCKNFVIKMLANNEAGVENIYTRFENGISQRNKKAPGD
jgi:hypothetical protein